MINMFDFHMGQLTGVYIGILCQVVIPSLVGTNSIESADTKYHFSVLAGRLQIDTTGETNSDLLQARRGTATVTRAPTAARTRRNCLGEALRPAWGAWPLWLPSWLFLLLSWSLASQMSAVGEGSGPSQISPPAPDLDHFWASGSLNQKMMNLPGR